MRDTSNPLDEEDDGRSRRVLIGLAFTLPAAALSVWLAWFGLRQLIYGQDPPRYVSEPQLSPADMRVFFAVLVLFAAFFCMVSIKLLVGVVTGRAPRRLVPWWLAWGLLGVVIALFLTLSVVGAIGGDLSGAAKCLGGVAFFGLLLFRSRGLRELQRADDACAEHRLPPPTSSVDAEIDSK
jgi:hypothetical protein